jgi:hypothetical protein
MDEYRGSTAKKNDLPNAQKASFCVSPKTVFAVGKPEKNPSAIQKVVQQSAC